MFPVSRIILNSFKYIGNTTGQDNLIYSLVISSIPGHLPFFRFFMQLRISVSVTLMFRASESKFLPPIVFSRIIDIIVFSTVYIL